MAIPQSDATVRSMRNRQLLGDANTVTLWQTFLGVPFVFAERDAFRELRTWTLEQLASAAAYLLGAGEPILAAETGLYRPVLRFLSYTAYRDVAVVVTAAHVLVLRFDRFDGQPRWVSLAAKPLEVTFEVFGAVVGVYATIVVHHGAQSWVIKGQTGIAQPGPVVAAWKSAVAAALRT